MKKVFVSLICAIITLVGFAQEPILEDINTVIRKHGLDSSEVMEIAGWITDVYGPRLTGSPMLDKASDWVITRLNQWGLKNVHLDEWGPFGRGWELERFEMHAENPNYFPIIAYPKAWSSSTEGEVRGDVIYLDAIDSASLEPFKGKLRGKFVLMDEPRKAEEWYKPLAGRIEDQELLKYSNADMPGPSRMWNRRRAGRIRFSDILWSFMEEEKPLAVVDRYFKGDLGTVFVSGARSASWGVWRENEYVVPQVTMALEHYNRIFRLVEKGIPVTLSLDLKARYTNPDLMEHNIIGEIPGTDLKDEIVMFGAHFDSWHTGTGATDNGAGSAVMMEVARILVKTIEETGIQPRRTLRLALWTGEEQGLYGSKSYVGKHLAETDINGNLIQVYPDQEKISAYYNLDNGTGKIRGVYMQGNESVRPIFRGWLDEFTDLDATTLTLSNTGGTDHLSFDAVGIPAFQFIQDQIAYGTRTHHSNMDNWDHLEEGDLKQAATIIASFIFHTAQREEKLPRKETNDQLK